MYLLIAERLSGLNPCCNGICSLREKVRVELELWVCLNPYVGKTHVKQTTDNLSDGKTWNLNGGGSAQVIAKL